MVKIKIDPDDLDDVFVIIEDSFGIHFEENLEQIQTFGALCDYVKSKITLINSEDCTSQQSFYKLRKALGKTTTQEEKTIKPDTSLNALLPQKNRRALVKALEIELGFKIAILRLSHYITVPLFLAIIGFAVVMLFNTLLGLLGVVLCLVMLYVASKTGKVLEVKEVGQLAEKITREHYLKSRRNTRSYNEKEIEKTLIDLFHDKLNIDKSKLTRDASFE